MLEGRVRQKTGECGGSGNRGERATDKGMYYEWQETEEREDVETDGKLMEVKGNLRKDPAPYGVDSGQV